jgi:spore coat protein U-like protein
MRKQIIAPIAAGVLLAFAGAAQAASKTASFTVSATVGKNCVISAGDLALGAFLGDNNLTAESDIDGALHGRHRFHHLAGRRA